MGHAGTSAPLRVEAYTGPQLKYIVKVLEADLRNWEPIEAANATWCLYSNGSGGIRVWRDQARSQEIISGFEYPWSDHPTSLWVEGILPGQVIVTLVNRDLHSRGATCDDDLYLTVVGVAAVKWQNPVTQAWMAMPGTLNIFKDTPLTFKAFPDPQDVEFPAGKPEWSGTSGASGSGETTTVTFGTQSQTCQDYKTLTVSCSSIPPDPPLTYNTIVYGLRKNFVPADNFAGRSYDQYGLGEDVTLGVIPDPAPCGGDPGAWFSLGYPTSVWAPPAIVCAAVPCSHTFKYKITSGPSPRGI